MLPNLKTPVLSATLALALSLATVGPVSALGKNERNFLKGVAATLVIGALLNQAQANHPPAQPVTRAVQVPTPYPQPQGHTPAHVIGSDTSSYAATSQAFRAYGQSDRRAIQTRLRQYGYYRGGIDGVFGPATYRATEAYARDSVGARALQDRAGAFGVFDSLIY